MMTLEQALANARRKLDEYGEGDPVFTLAGEQISKWEYVRICETEIRNEWENFQQALLPMPDMVSRFCTECAKNEFDFENFRHPKCVKCWEYSGNYWKARRVALAWWREPTAMREDG